MGRHIKIGLDYFPVHTDIENDDKIQLIEAAYGSIGFAIVIKLLAKIYKENGYYYPWTDKEKLLFIRKNPTSIDIIDGVITECVRWGLFDKSLFDEYKILTSAGIQKRYLVATDRRDLVEIIQEYSLTDINDCKNVIYVNINKKDVSKSTHSKVNKSKEEKIKEKQMAFYQTLTPFLSDYGKDMLREFYNYWSEPNKPLTKIRCELEKTWDVKLRLNRWAGKDNNFDNPPAPDTKNKFKELVEKQNKNA